ncbi:MAG TPA: DUF2092 domain-containing protein [Chthonomonadaceae bacterium]|nr:DUF2092 domain-containing protein [Chthonomonadaceae bacterium]
MLVTTRWGLAGAALSLLMLLGASPGRADEKGDALLKEVEKATKAAKTLTAEVSFTETMSGQGQKISATGKVRLMRPNYAYIALDSPVDQVLASDGKTSYTLMSKQNQYLKNQVDAQGHGLGFLPPMTMFFDTKGGITSLFGGDASALSPKYVGKETVEGKEYEVLRVTQENPQHVETKLYVGQNKLVTRIHMEVKLGNETAQIEVALKNVKTDTAMKAADFAFQLPKGAKEFTQPSMDDYEKKLVAVGKDAPTFSLPTLSGTETTIYEATKDKKVMLLNFWFYG